MQTKRQDQEFACFRELDGLIVCFEDHVGHCDKGFDKWIKRHQAAMEAGDATVRDWPYMEGRIEPDEFRRRLDQGWEPKWRTTKWYQRYTWLVHQRQLFARDRLQEMDLKQGAFFGAFPATPPRTKLCSAPTKKPLTLESEWCWPLDALLERFASDRHRDPSELRAEFWKDKTSSEVEEDP